MRLPLQLNNHAKTGAWSCVCMHALIQNLVEALVVHINVCNVFGENAVNSLEQSLKWICCLNIADSPEPNECCVSGRIQTTEGGEQD